MDRCYKNHEKLVATVSILNKPELNSLTLSLKPKRNFLRKKWSESLVYAGIICIQPCKRFRT